MAGSRLASLALGCLLVAGCSQTTPPQAASVPQTTTPTPPSPPPEYTEDPVPADVKGNEPIVIDTGGEEEEEPSLAEAAEVERRRRQATDEPILVVDDKNISQHAVGKLTYADEAAAPPEGEASGEPGDVTGEPYWRNRVRTLRQDWRDAVDEILELEGEIAGLRNRFYAEDDPYVRDGQIKPAWDHALERMSQAQSTAHQREMELGEALEEGRAAGALPGWLREGLELEPEERPYNLPETERDDAIIGEPDVVGEGEGGRR